MENKGLKTILERVESSNQLDRILQHLQVQDLSNSPFENSLQPLPTEKTEEVT